MPKLGHPTGALVFRICRFTEVSSTNDVAGQPEWGHGDVVRAEFQTRGRGQRGNRWDSRQGQNLTFSVILKPEKFPVEDQFYISKTASLSIVGALADLGLQAEIKWPNDIYIGQRKVAGILIENDLMGAFISKSIIGIGININQASFDPALPNPTSVMLECGQPVEKERVLEIFLKQLSLWYEMLSDEKYAEIDSAYKESLYRKNGEYLFRDLGSKPFLASIEEVLPTGELILKRSDGSLKSYLFKEIEFLFVPS